MGFHFNLLGGILLVLVLLPGDSSSDVHVGVDLVTRLGNNLFHAVFKKTSAESENFVVSPFGLLSSLAMVLEASRDKTREEILQALDVADEDVPELRKGFRAYCELFSKFSDEAEAAGAFNAATVRSSFRLDPAYEDVLRKHYCANVSRESSDRGAALELSSISGVMSHWKDYEKLAVYTFLSHQSLRPFHKRNGSAVPVPMIPQVGVFGSKRWENSRVVLLPLQAKLVDLLLMIPDKMEDAEAAVKKLTDHGLPLLVQSTVKQELEVFLPQMALVAKDSNLTSLLVRGGIRRAFDPKKADLTGAAADPAAEVHVKGIRQNAYFSTSFVALNSVSGISAPLEAHRRVRRDAEKVYVDRPFLFFVLQKDTQLVLLAGKVENPLQVPT